MSVDYPHRHSEGLIHRSLSEGGSRGILSIPKKLRSLQSLRSVGMTLLIILLTTPASAEDKKLDDILAENNPPPAGYYSPEFCDFEITFPEKPYTSKRCPSGTGQECYNIHGFMMVYDLTTTVDVTANCAPSTPENYNRYNEAVVKAALNGMVSRANIKNFTISTQNVEETRQGSLLGTGTHGKQDTIYNAQLWVGQNSILTVEAKLIGADHDKADKVFSYILKSMRLRDK